MSFAQPTHTWGEVAQNIRRSFGDESGVQLEDGDLVRWINQGQYEIARQNKIFKAKGTTNTMPGQPGYTLNLGKPILQIESIRMGETRLVPTEFTTVDANLEEYSPTAEGDPRIWYHWGDEVVLWPTPKNSQPLTVFFTAAPKMAETLEPNKLLELPDDYYLPLIDFCMAKAHEMDDNPDGQKNSLQLYQERLSTMYNEERAGQTLSFQTITIVD